MNTKLKVLLTVAVVTALAGTGSTYSLWRDYLTNNAAISAGDLDVALVGGMAWTDKNNTAINMGTFLTVPGDILTGTQPVSIGLQGDNLLAQVSLERNGVKAGLGQIDGNLPAGFSLSGPLETTLAGTPGVKLSVALTSPDGTILTAPTDAAGSYFQASSIGQGGGEDDDWLPVIVAPSASAGDTDPELLVKVTATFDPSTSGTDRQAVSIALNTIKVAVTQLPTSYRLGGLYVAGWGANGSAQLGLGDPLQATSPVEVDATGVLAGKTVTDVVTANAFTCALAGDVYCWGVGVSYQLGNGLNIDKDIPVAVSTAGLLAGKTVTQIAAGDNHACALANGAVYCWGSNSYGQLGDNSVSTRTAPVAVDMAGVLAGKTVTAITAGSNHTCAIATDQVYCWGYNVYGAIGDNSLINRLVPVAVDTTGVLAGKTVIAIEGGQYHTCALASGAAYCWGNNGSGRLGNNSTTNSSIPVAVISTGVLAGKSVSAISAGWSHTCVVASSAAYCWGYGANGQMGDATSTSSRLAPVAVTTTGVLSGKVVESISAGANQTCAVADGASYCWGYNNYGQLGDATQIYKNVPVPVNTSGVLAGKLVRFTATGYLHTCAVADSKLYCWGFAQNGRLGTGSGTFKASPVQTNVAPLAGKTIVGLATGDMHSCALASGTVYCWGQNSNAQLGNGTTTDSSLPVAVGGLLSGKTVTAIAAGYAHTCALAAGSMYCWGYGGYGQIGDGGGTSRTTPVAVSTSGVLAGKTVTAIAAGGYHSCAIADDLPYCWGYNPYGQIGDGSIINRLVPVAVDTSGVLANKIVTAVSAGYVTTCVIASGEAFCWGSGSYGKLGDGPGVNRATPVAVSTAGVLAGKTVTSIQTGNSHTCAIANGAAYCWGYNAGGRLGDGTSTQRTTPVRLVGLADDAPINMIAVGTTSTCLISNGAVYCFGSNDEGELGDGTTTASTAPKLVAGMLDGKQVRMISGNCRTILVAY